MYAVRMSSRLSKRISINKNHIAQFEMNEKLTINRWAVEDRPREKMMMHGVSSLSNAELLAILIGSGNTEESAVDLMRKVLSDYHNNLNELGKVSIDELCKYKGI